MNLNDSSGKSSLFPPVTRQEWEARIREELDGGDYEKKMIWKPLEGFHIMPFYTAEDLEGLGHLESPPGSYPFVRGIQKGNNNWKIRHDILVNDVTTANNKALDAISKGAESIGFVFGEGTDAFPIVPDPEALHCLLRDIPIPSVPLHFVAGNLGIRLFQWLNEENHEDKISGSLGIDPMGDFCLSGVHKEQVYTELSTLIRRSENQLPDVRIISVNAGHIHNAGATLVQELAFGLAMGNEYLSILTGLDCEGPLVASRMQFHFAVGSNYFFEIAKFRAARYLWARIMEARGADTPESLAMMVHSETSGWNKTMFDPYVNILRSTTEAMAAVLGGTSFLSIKPFDAVFRQPGEFSERIARNTQIILKEEAYFDKVADPAAGSYYIESLTGSMINEAWKLFLETENRGGFLKAFREGWIQEQVEATAAERDRNLAFRKDILVGTNQYPAFNEFNPGIEITAPVEKRKELLAESDTKPLRLYRGASVFEEIRMRTQNSGRQPKVFLLTYGSPAMRRARASFARNFFACAGFEVIDNQGFELPADGIKASLEQKADITVICSADEEYPRIVPEICEKIKDRSLVAVAGYPKDSLDQLKDAGVRHFVHLRSDIVETLQVFQRELGIIK